MYCKQTRNRSKHAPRRGAVLLMTIVCVAVSLTILAALVNIAHLRYATQKNHQRRAQATCLLESGLERAVASLAADPAYKGETWKIAANEFNAAAAADTPPALVRIEIKTVADNSDKREIHITADYADEPKLSARRSKQTTLTLIPAETAEKPAPKKSETEKPKSEKPKIPETVNTSNE